MRPFGRLPVVLAGVLCAVVLAASLVVLTRPTTAPDGALEAVIALCEGGGVQMDPTAPSAETWAGSVQDSEAWVRCAWPGVGAAAVAERLEALGWGEVTTSDDVVDWRGREGAFVVAARGGGPEISASAHPDDEALEVVVGGFIHVHDDGTVHTHDAEGRDVSGG